MSVLRNIEHKIEGLFEGVFGRAFRTHVQPVELARKLTKEMEDHRVVSVSRVYAPNEYSIYLSPSDREQFASYEDSLRSELQDYLAENARRERYELLSAPEVVFETDDDLEMGEFGIATRMVQGPAPKPGEPPSEPEHGQTMVYRKPVETEAVSVEELGLGREVVSLTVNGTKHELDGIETSIGRGKDCDIQLADPNVSRRHAEIRQEGAAYWAVDLDSTNGMEVNGRRQKRAKLRQGDKITIGSTELALPAGGGGRVTLASIAVQEALLVLKVAFLVLLYLFIWRIVRTAARDVTLPQESFVLAPGSVPGLGDAGTARRGRQAHRASRARRSARARSGSSTRRR